GLLGAAISGAGSTMIAFVTDNGEAIAAEMVRRIESKGAKARALQVNVDNRGRQMS
ncbi:MAG: homoserine kinase, partial [Acidobacteria bacterium]|nr:homoserine kinase [Acidobacteriota bacterium]